MGNLSAFMKNEFKKEGIVEIPGFDRFTDDNGKPVKFHVRVLPFDKIEAIRGFYRHERIAYDRKKNPIIANGQIVKEVSYDNTAAAKNIMIEALVYPNLKDKDLMKFYDCEDVMDMPYKVFTQEEYAELQNRLAVALHLATPEDGDEDDVEAAKN